MRVFLALACAAVVAATGCAHPTPVASAPNVHVAPTEESAVQAAALAEESRVLQPLDTIWVERTTHGMFDSDSAADAWARENAPVITRVSPELLAAYARANVEGAPVEMPRSGVRGHPVGRPRVAPALATQTYQIFSLTRPGFTPSGDTAFLMVTRSCGNLCGRVEGLLVAREKKHWRVVTTAWQSYR